MTDRSDEYSEVAEKAMRELVTNADLLVREMSDSGDTVVNGTQVIINAKDGASAEKIKKLLDIFGWK